MASYACWPRCAIHSASAPLTKNTCTAERSGVASRAAEKPPTRSPYASPSANATPSNTWSHRQPTAMNRARDARVNRHVATTGAIRYTTVSAHTTGRTLMLLDRAFHINRDHGSHMYARARASTVPTTNVVTEASRVSDALFHWYVENACRNVRMNATTVKA